MSFSSLWGDEFVVQETPVKKIIDKINNPKKNPEVCVEKLIKSKSISIYDKLQLITENVHKILGVYEDNTVIIKTREQLHNYIDCAIQNKVIAIDTETNNSLDPITCKIMGGCIYTPGQKNAYIPINHVDVETNERLSWQLTEKDLFEEFSRINDATDVITIFHNGKFDYQVIYCTCGIKMRIDWDTMIGAKLIDEMREQV